MKRKITAILSLVCALILAVALAACNDKTGPTDPDDPGGETPAVKYTVVFDANGGKFEKGEIDIGDGETIDDGAEISADGSTMTLTFGSDIMSEPWRLPERAQHAFCGWAKDKEGEELWDFEAEEKLSGDITLYAVWAVSFDFRLSDDKSHYIVRGIGGLSGDVEVPETHNRKPVTEIDKEAFKNSRILTGIIIPDSVTSIGNKAFQNATKLESVAIGEGITEIGEQVFDGCTALAELSLPKSLEKISYTAFDNDGSKSIVEVRYAGSIDDWCGMDMDCSTEDKANPLANGKAELYIDGQAVSEITVNAEKINQYAFYGCKTIDKVTIGKDVKTIGEMAFYYNDITSLSFAADSTLRTVGVKAFMRTKIKKLVLPDSVQTLSTSAFEDCNVLTDVDLGGTKTVSSKAFGNCFLVENIDFGNVEYLGDGAFTGNSVINEDGSLASVTIPNTAWYIGRGCFGDQPALNSVTFASSATWKAYALRTDDPAETVTTANMSAAATARKMKETAHWIRIAGSLTYSGDTVTGVSSTSGIGMLEVPKINNGTNVTKIAANAFKDFKGLRYLTIEANVTDIGNGFVDGCDGLATVTVAGNNSTYASTGSLLYKKNGSIIWINPALRSTQYLTVPSGVKSIPAGMFTGMEIKFLQLPQSVTEIADGAFAGSTIEQAEIPACAAKHIVNDKLWMADIISGTALPDNAFKGAVSLEHAYLPDSLTSIGAHAFENCVKLESITLPDKVTSIGADAFKGCTALKDIEISEDSDAFSKQDGILYNKDKTQFIFIPKNISGKITIPDGITAIGAGAFEDCGGITEIVIPESVTSVDKTAFDGCTNLIRTENGMSYVDKWAIDCDNAAVSVTLRADTAGISSGAFDGCDALESIVVPESNALYSSKDGILYDKAQTAFVLVPNALKGAVTISDGITEIGTEAFAGRSGLTQVTIGNGVTSIGQRAFKGCGITSITLGANVETVGANAFEGCRFKNIALPASVTAIPSSAFNECNLLSSITVADNNATYMSRDGILYNKNQMIIVHVPQAITGNITVPNGVTSIRYQDFYRRSQMTGITLPDGLLTIEENAFGNCYRLATVVIPDSVTSIGEQAFYTCESLTSITIGGGVETIGEEAFLRCGVLESIVIPDSVTSIGNRAFYSCDKLKSAEIGVGITVVPSELFIYCDALERVTLKGAVTSISSGAFNGCNALTSITLPSTLKTISSKAFSVCSSLTNIALPDGLLAIYDNAFQYCKALSSISIPDSVTEIGNDAFLGCTGLILSDGGVQYVDKWIVGSDKLVTSATVRAGTKGIGDSAFKDRDALASVTLPDGLRIIGNGAFQGCKELSEINIPSSVVRVGRYAFSNCSKAYTENVSGVRYVDNWAVNTFMFAGVTGLQIVSGTVGLADSVLSGLGSLRDLVLPESLKYIGESAFWGCKSLNNITFYGSEEQWAAVVKGENWDYDMPAYTVSCDG